MLFYFIESSNESFFALGLKDSRAQAYKEKQTIEEREGEIY